MIDDSLQLSCRTVFLLFFLSSCLLLFEFSLEFFNCDFELPNLSLVAFDFRRVLTINFCERSLQLCDFILQFSLGFCINDFLDYNFNLLF